MALELYFRYLFIFLVLLPSYFISGFFINIIQLTLYLTLRNYRKRIYRKINWYLCYYLHCQKLFIYEWYSGSEVYLYTDRDVFEKYFGKEHACVILNHKYETDWLVVGAIADYLRLAGNFKAFMKKSLSYLPVVGWNLFFGENVFLNRSFDKDKAIIQEKMSDICDYADPVCLVLYPEGTRFTTKKYQNSLEYAKTHGLPLLKHHLSPRTKAFVVSAPMIRHTVGAIYDMLVSFRPDDKIKPSFSNIICGRKVKAFVYIKRIPFSEVPEDEEGASQFIHDMFVRKDKLQDSFFNTGDYFAESGVERVEGFKLPRTYPSLICTVTTYIVVLTAIIRFIVKLLMTATFSQAMAAGIVTVTFLALSYITLAMGKIKETPNTAINTKAKTN